jgi:hypothetical protein
MQLISLHLTFTLNRTVCTEAGALRRTLHWGEREGLEGEDRWDGEVDRIHAYNL